jgi:hypothetical protein
MVGYTSATTGRAEHEVHEGHVVAWGEGGNFVGSRHTARRNAHICFPAVPKIQSSMSLELGSEKELTRIMRVRVGGHLPAMSILNLPL